MKTGYFFISQDENLRVLQPRIPRNFFTKNEYEDDHTPRVCLSKSLQGCLSALSQNLEGKIFQVYSASSQKIVQPTIEQVPDCEVTEEVWSLTPVKLTPIYKIEVTCAIDRPLTFEYGGKKAHTYHWNYEKIS